ncbi:unnamed protein product [Effrenium voratum]|nr:unnamed protein product [Effrenium voratum]
MLDLMQCRALLLAFFDLQELACSEGGRIVEERNNVVHALEKNRSLQDFVTSGQFPRLQELYRRYMKGLSDKDEELADAFAFVRLLDLAREALYEEKEELVAPWLPEALCELKMQGFDLVQLKAVNRLRNAFKYQTSKRLEIPQGKASQIAKQLNEMSLSTDVEVREALVGLLPEECHPHLSLDQLWADYRNEVGGEPKPIELPGALHLLGTHWFKCRAAPRLLAKLDVQLNADKLFAVSDGAFFHGALKILADKYADLKEVPDIGPLLLGHGKVKDLETRLRQRASRESRR